MTIGGFISEANLFDEKAAGIPKHIQELLDLEKFEKE